MRIPNRRGVDTMFCKYISTPSNLLIIATARRCTLLGEPWLAGHASGKTAEGDSEATVQNGEAALMYKGEQDWSDGTSTRQPVPCIYSRSLQWLFYKI